VDVAIVIVAFTFVKIIDGSNMLNQTASFTNYSQAWADLNMFLKVIYHSLMHIEKLIKTII
jgi:hypothetical protein